MVELGNLAGTSGAEWIGRPQHEELQPKARPLLPRDDPFYQPPAGFQHAEPGTVLRSRDVEVAFLGLIPASRHGHPTALPDDRHERPAGGDRDHRDRPG